MNDKADPTSKPFGTVFADRISIAWYRDGQWSEARTQPSDSLTLHPGAHALHYGSACFEGLKAYRWADDSVHIFRLDRHIERIRKSAELLCLPAPDPEQLAAMVCDLVAMCRAQIPPAPGALYIRPTLIGTEANIGAAGRPASEACLYVLLSPVGDYFSGGDRPLRLLVENRHMRTVPEFGMAKAGANYVLALRQIVAAKAQFAADQVLFCPHGDVQETGAANFLLLNDATVWTKPLGAEFLHGVTRDSILRIAAPLGYEVRERDFTVSELFRWVRRGEAALSGTAAVLAGVGTLIHRGKERPVAGGGIGPNTLRLRQALIAIQRGTAPDEFGWLTDL